MKHSFKHFACFKFTLSSIFCQELRNAGRNEGKLRNGCVICKDICWQCIMHASITLKEIKKKKSVRFAVKISRSEKSREQ
jgi:hypothetical protein